MYYSLPVRGNLTQPRGASVTERAGRQPVIIIGMHRSGTSMISRMLEELGLFVGKRKTNDNEAVFFLGLNEWLLRQSNGAWDHPEPIRDLLRHAEVRGLVADYVARAMRSPSVVGYLGWRNYLRYATPRRMDVPWGWKDPRTTYTLPLWLDLFPGARVVHIYRNGVDIANSLRKRENKRIVVARESYGRRKALYLLRPKQGRFTGSLMCTDLERAFELWLSYATEARAHVRRLGDRAMEMRYEDFLAEPQGSLASLARFCGLPDDERAVARVSEGVRKDRAYAYRNDPELRALAGRFGEELAAWGYA